MGKLTITGKELRAIGYPEGPVISMAMNIVHRKFKHGIREEVMKVLKEILEKPEAFEEDAIWASIAGQLMPPEVEPDGELSLNQTGIQFNTYGAEHIEQGAMHQMYAAAKLPVAVAGALMPDAHQGYGLPIGGVLATDNAVIPYGVGVDIGCRMCLSVFDIGPDDLHRKRDFFASVLDESTLFGSGAQFDRSVDHEVMDQALFFELPLLKRLHTRAWKQLGSSGSGNHFAEFGLVEIGAKDEVLGIAPGTYVGFLTHSGSRALGAHIANHYTKIAISKRRLPQGVKNLAWLHLDEEEGMEYWLAMNLAGDYASACHHVIHDKISRELGRKPMRRVENHHNFAWKEIWNGREVIVHRKGATPAGKDVLGIIGY
jgi:tRNA-splicing ligase RtcB